MIPDFAMLMSSLIAILFGASIAAWHLALLRMGLSSFETRRNPGRSVVIMSLLRIVSVAMLLLVVARQLDSLPLFLFITSFTVARMYLLPRYLHNAQAP